MYTHIPAHLNCNNTCCRHRCLHKTPCENTLHIRKRALHIWKRALYVRKQATVFTHTLQHISTLTAAAGACTKRGAKNVLVLKKFYISAKKILLIHTRALYIQKRALYVRKQATLYTHTLQHIATSTAAAGACIKRRAKTAQFMRKRALYIHERATVYTHTLQHQQQL